MIVRNTSPLLGSQEPQTPLPRHVRRLHRRQAAIAKARARSTPFVSPAKLPQPFHTPYDGREGVTQIPSKDLERMLRRAGMREQADAIRAARDGAK